MSKRPAETEYMWEHEKKIAKKEQREMNVVGRMEERISHKIIVMM